MSYIKIINNCSTNEYNDRPDKSQLSLVLRGETSKGESKYFVKYFRQREQIQYPCKGNNR